MQAIPYSYTQGNKAVVSTYRHFTAILSPQTIPGQVTVIGSMQSRTALQYIVAAGRGWSWGWGYPLHKFTIKLI